MLKPIDTSKYTQSALRALGYLPAKRNVIGTGWVAAVNIQCDKPLIIEMENGTLFKLGGLSHSQLGQLSAISDEIIGERISFIFQGRFNNLDQPLNPVFTTLLLDSNMGCMQ